MAYNLPPVMTTEEVAIGNYLGRGNHDPETETTLIYCPWEPDYLINCREAAEAFVREINCYPQVGPAAALLRQGGLRRE